ncbi:hypothetical protein NECAME_01202 [Necator americanus]|uniref:Uncharacterized protein n=1 Tax=Necator americanus TaxID=51031 RepID=W2TY98_NECAM|nr:hypothetical protein NECAME_01202 [Necator americanus]ETN87045.1 hypothetical protein NECAME_01202 [Necator americanus]
MKVATDMMTTVNATFSIARRRNLSQFMIFGDDQKFMLELSKMITDQGNWNENVWKAFSEAAMAKNSPFIKLSFEE